VCGVLQVEDESRQRKSRAILLGLERVRRLQRRIARNVEGFVAMQCSLSESQRSMDQYCRASAAARAIAGHRGIAEVDTPCALQQIAADRSHMRICGEAPCRIACDKMNSLSAPR